MQEVDQALCKGRKEALATRGLFFWETKTGKREQSSACHVDGKHHDKNKAVIEAVRLLLWDAAQIFARTLAQAWHAQLQTHHGTLTPMWSADESTFLLFLSCLSTAMVS